MTAPTDGDAQRLAALVRDGGVVVLSGAGVSTASGIPDYRGVTGRTRTRAPMTWAEFEGSERARRRYWAGAALAARRFRDVAPNAAHRAIAELEQRGLVDAVVTQNVDGLHQRAGSVDVTEIHGSLRSVSCRTCELVVPRQEVVGRLHERNPWLATAEPELLADGDARADEDVLTSLRIVDCHACGGQLRPDVVFFGELVPKQRMARARASVGAARSLLVAGSSLTVGSGRLLVRHALRAGARLAIVNIGPTRADDQAALRVEADVGATLDAALSMLVGADGASGPTAGPGAASSGTANG